MGSEPQATECIVTVLYNVLYSLRSMFSEEDDAHNPLHGSATLEEAEKELQYFFPKEKTLAVIKPNAIDSRGKHTNYISGWTSRTPSRTHLQSVPFQTVCIQYNAKSWCVLFMDDWHISQISLIMGSALLLSTVLILI